MYTCFQRVVCECGECAMSVETQEETELDASTGERDNDNDDERRWSATNGE